MEEPDGCFQFKSGIAGAVSRFARHLIHAVAGLHAYPCFRSRLNASPTLIPFSTAAVVTATSTAGAITAGVDIPITTVIAAITATVPGYRQYNGAWFPLGAFAAGAIIGGAVAQPPMRYGGSHVEWCANRYRSYRAYDNTYQPNNGPRRQCNSPY